MTQREMYVASLNRPKDYATLSPEEQWEIDKKLGILDWDGKQYPCLTYGLNAELPDSVGLAYGARWIFPDDIVHDRQAVIGRDHPDVPMLAKWLDGVASGVPDRQKGALGKALKEARRLASKGLLKPSDNRVVILYEDDQGIVKGNPNASYGYLYVVAYLKEVKPGRKGVTV